MSLVESSFSLDNLAESFVASASHATFALSPFRLHVCAMNQAAELLLRTDCRVAIKNGRLVLLTHELQNMLDHIIQSCLSDDASNTRGGRLVVPGDGIQPVLVVEVIPLGVSDKAGRVPLVGVQLRTSDQLRDNVDDEELLVALFGFTPAEVRLVQAVMTGQSMPEYSNSVGISHETARTHLRNVMRKTGVKSQVQLVAKILNVY